MWIANCSERCLASVWYVLETPIDLQTRRESLISLGPMDNISRYQRNPIKAYDDRCIKGLLEIWEREWQVVWLWLKRMRSCLVDLYFKGRGRGLTNIGWRERRSEKRRPDLKLEIECQSRTLLHFSWSLPCALCSLLAGSSEIAFNHVMNIKPLRIEFHRTEKV